MSAASPSRPDRSAPAIGVILPNFRPGATPEAMLAATETAERLGWHSVWTTDHILPDRSQRARAYEHIYEALSTLAWLGGRFERIRMGVSVLVVPMRNAVVLAKELASIDALLGGRLITGIGIGWSETEFGNLGEQRRFGVRGAYAEETVALWRHLWSGSQEPFQGRFHAFADFAFSPLPRQGEQLPIWIGATAESALRRVGRVADGYHATRSTPAHVHERALIIRAAAEEAGRPMPLLSARVSLRFDTGGQPPWVLSGTDEEVRAGVRAYRDSGVEHLAIDFSELDPERLAATMERFDREVLRDR